MPKSRLRNGVPSGCGVESAGTGALTPGQLVDQMPEFDLDAAMAVSANGASVYAGSDAGIVATFARDQATGLLGSPFTVRDGTGETMGLADLHHLAVTPDDQHVLAASGQPGAVTVLRRASDSGALSFVESYADGAPGFGWLAGARDIVMSPDSRFAYVIAQDDETITVLERVRACAPAPAVSCQGASKARLKVKHVAGDGKRTVVWKWARTSVPVVGDPLTTSDLALCIYDASGGDQPRIDAAAPAGGTCGAAPCWKPVDGGFRYADKNRTPDGVQRIKISPKPGATSTVTVKARGTNVPVFSLPVAAPVTVQLQASSGECLEATFTAATINDGTKVVATLP